MYQNEILKFLKQYPLDYIAVSPKQLKIKKNQKLELILKNIVLRIIIGFREKHKVPQLTKIINKVNEYTG